VVPGGWFDGPPVSRPSCPPLSVCFSIHLL
jgi:hypothetical protein